MHFKCCLFVLLLSLSACATTETDKHAGDTMANRQMTVQGSASITEAGVDRARQAAIDDAIVNVSAQFKPGKDSSFVASDIKVVDEWQEGGVYHVQVLAVSSNKQQSCQSSYRKRMVATAFPAMDTEQISGSDSQDLYNGIPREISNQLMEGGDFIVRNLTNTSLYDEPDLAPEIPWVGRYWNSPLSVIARRNKAQLVLAGVIRDFKVESTEYIRGSGILALLKSTVRDFVARRSIGIDVYIYDGFTGALVFQQRYTDSVLGDVTIPTGYSVGSERFNSSPAGHKISQIIEMAADDIQQMFACYPFAGYVDRVDNGKIIIAAGAQDGIRLGDRLMVYAAGNTRNIGLGFSDPIGIMVISDVGPSMAAGQLERTVNPTIVRPGDWVRSFSSH